MKICLTCARLKEMYQFCAGAMSKNPEKELLRFIHLKVDERGVTAYALDGYRLARKRVISDVMEWSGALLLPVVDIPKGAFACEISAEGGSVTLTFDNETTVRVEPPVECFPKVENLEKSFREEETPTLSIWFHPKMLQEALKAVQSGKKRVPVRLDFFHARGPVVLQLDGDAAQNRLLVLPVKPKAE